MKTFEHFDSSGDTPCPLCGTQVDSETILIAINGTNEDMNYEAIQVHVDCLEECLRYDREHNVIYAI